MAGENEPVEAGQFLGENGAFQENWRDVAFEEGDPLRENPTLANIKDIRTLAKQVVSGESTIGKLSGNRDFAILPNEQSTDEERAKYHTKIGRPDAPEGYLLGEVPVPAGIPRDEKFEAHMGKVLFDAGTPKVMGAKIVKGYVDHIVASVEAANVQQKVDNQEANTQLRTTLGAAYDETMKDGAAAIRAFGSMIDAAEAEEMIKELPYDTFAAQFCGTIGKLIREKGLQGTPIPSGELTPADAQAEIDKIQTDPYYVTAAPKDKLRNEPYHKQLVDKVTKLFEIKNKK